VFRTEGRNRNVEQEEEILGGGGRGQDEDKAGGGGVVKVTRLLTGQDVL
jgi:hypothetical protein